MSSRLVKKRKRSLDNSSDQNNNQQGSSLISGRLLAMELDRTSNLKNDELNKSIDDKNVELDNLKKELSTKNELINKQSEFLKSIDNNLHCSICLEYMTEPFGLSCGHVACYSCLKAWFSRHSDIPEDDKVGRHSKICPSCRSVIRFRPNELFIIKDLVSISALAQNENPDPVDIRQGDLWEGIFGPLGDLPRLKDEDDGVYRCAYCAGEIFDNRCTNCGEWYTDNEDEEHLNESNDDHNDNSSNEEEDLDRRFGAFGDFGPSESESGSEIDRSPRRRQNNSEIDSRIAELSRRVLLRHNRSSHPSSSMYGSDEINENDGNNNEDLHSRWSEPEEENYENSFIDDDNLSDSENNENGENLSERGSWSGWNGNRWSGLSEPEDNYEDSFIDDDDNSTNEDDFDDSNNNSMNDVENDFDRNNDNDDIEYQGTSDEGSSPKIQAHKVKSTSLINNSDSDKSSDISNSVPLNIENSNELDSDASDNGDQRINSVIRNRPLSSSSVPDEDRFHDSFQELNNANENNSQATSSSSPNHNSNEGRIYPRLKNSRRIIESDEE